jgi:polysaccharide biosynthesis/export protein
MQQFAWPDRSFRKTLLSAALVFVLAAAGFAQNAATTSAQNVPSASAEAADSSLRLLIGPGDEIQLTVYGIPDLNQQVQVDSNGDVSLALVGNVEVAGLTAQEAQTAIEARYVNGGYLKNPHITVFVKEYTTQKVTVAGEVTKPGVYPLTSNHRLQDVILAAGGLTEKAGKTVSITHAQDPEKPVVLALSDDPVKAAESNAEILPGDTVVIARAGIVYVIGEVNRAGAYVMENSGTMTVTQAIARAAGPTGLASLNGTRIIRRTPSGLKTIDLEVNKILQAKKPDVTLQPEDIVYVPGSKSKGFMQHSGNSIFAMLTSLAIYRF